MIESWLMVVKSNDNNSHFNSRIIVGLLGVVLFGGWLYCSEVVRSPENVFWGSLSNNLSMASVVRTVEQKQPGLEVSRNLRVTSGENLSVRALVDIKQTTSKNKTTKVKSENIITKNKNVARYISIQSDINKDLKKIENKWFIDPSSSEQNLASIYEALGLIPGYITGSPPFLLLSGNSKKAVLADLRDVYKPNFESVKKISYNGKQAYEYEVEVNVSRYVHFLQSIRNQLGLTDLGLRPEDYEQNQPVKTVMVVTITGRQITKMTEIQQNRQENYSNHGVASTLQLPKPEVSKDIIDAYLR